MSYIYRICVCIWRVNFVYKVLFLRAVNVLRKRANGRASCATQEKMSLTTVFTECKGSRCLIIGLTVRCLKWVLTLLKVFPIECQNTTSKIASDTKNNKSIPRLRTSRMCACVCACCQFLTSRKFSLFIAGLVTVLSSGRRFTPVISPRTLTAS